MNAPERIWWNVAPLPHSYTSTIQFAGGTEYRRADLPPTDAEVMNHPKVRATVEAAATLGRIVGFLGDDEVRIAAFREACGSDLWCRASAAIQEAKP